MKTRIQHLFAVFLAVFLVAAPVAFAEDEDESPRVFRVFSKGHCAQMLHRGHDNDAIRGLGSYGYLGVETTALTPELRRHFGVPDELGVMISRIEEGSPAEAAGLVVGDIITRVADGDVTSGGRLRRLVRAYEADEEAVVEYWRDRQVGQATVAFAERETCGFDVGSVIDLEDLPGFDPESFPHLDKMDLPYLQSLPYFEHALELHELDGEKFEEARERFREVLERRRELDQESLAEARERLREALENQDWSSHLKRMEDVDLSGIEERLREAMERLHVLEDEIRIEKKRIVEDDGDDGESQLY